jgi:hypothetical protein
MDSQMELLALENDVFLSNLWLIHRRHMFTIILEHAARSGLKGPSRRRYFIMVRHQLANIVSSNIFFVIHYHTSMCSDFITLLFLPFRS